MPSHRRRLSASNVHSQRACNALLRLLLVVFSSRSRSSWCTRSSSAFMRLSDRVEGTDVCCHQVRVVDADQAQFWKRTCCAIWCHSPSDAYSCSCSYSCSSRAKGQEDEDDTSRGEGVRWGMAGVGTGGRCRRSLRSSWSWSSASSWQVPSAASVCATRRVQVSSCVQSKCPSEQVFIIRLSKC